MNERLLEHYRNLETSSLLALSKNDLTEEAQSALDAALAERGDSTALAATSGDSTSKSLDGVGGWLRLLTIVLMISPAAGLAFAWQDILDVERKYPSFAHLSNWHFYVVAATSIYLAQAVVCTRAAWALTKWRSRSAVTLAIAAVWSGPAAGFLQLLALAFLFGGVGPGAAGLPRSVISASIWTCYLVFSKRVEATYGPVS